MTARPHAQVCKACFPNEYEAWVKSEDKEVKKERKNAKAKKLDEGALPVLEKRNRAAASWFKLLLECARDRPAWESLVALCREAAAEAPTSPQRVAAQVRGQEAGEGEGRLLQPAVGLPTYMHGPLPHPWGGHHPHLPPLPHPPCMHAC